MRIIFELKIGALFWIFSFYSTLRSCRVRGFFSESGECRLLKCTRFSSRGSCSRIPLLENDHRSMPIQFFISSWLSQKRKESAAKKRALSEDRRNVGFCVRLSGGHNDLDDFEDRHCTDQGVDISPAGDGGVRKLFKSPGHESIALSAGDEVSVYLIGKVHIPDGETITFLNHSCTPFTFRFGKGQVIRGLEMAVASMKIGEKSVFHIGPKYGYSCYGDDIPWKAVGANDTVVFEVELLCCGEKDLTEGKGGVLFKTLHTEHGFDQPEHMDEVLVSLVGSGRDGREFARTEAPVWVDLGSGLLPRGLVLAIQQMTVGMQARIQLLGSWAFRSAPSAP